MTNAAPGGVETPPPAVYVIDQGPAPLPQVRDDTYHSKAHDNAGRQPIRDLVKVTSGLAQELIDRAQGDADEHAAMLAAILVETNARVAGDSTEAGLRAAADTALAARVSALEALTEFKLALAAGQQLTSNSTTFQNVTWAGGVAGLALAVGAIWHFRGTVIYLSTPAADFKFSFIGPAGAALFSTVMTHVDTALVVQQGVLLGLGGSVPCGGDSTNHGVEVSGTIACGATPGTFNLQVAQNTATVETTDFIVAGSNFQFTRAL